MGLEGKNHHWFCTDFGVNAINPQDRPRSNSRLDRWTRKNSTRGHYKDIMELLKNAKETRKTQGPKVPTAELGFGVPVATYTPVAAAGLPLLMLILVAFGAGIPGFPATTELVGAL